MGRSSPQSQNKRMREQLKQDKRRAKEDKRAARKAAKQTDSSTSPGRAAPDTHNRLIIRIPPPIA
jgi:hypothetical protein